MQAQNHRVITARSASSEMSPPRPRVSESSSIVYEDQESFGTFKDRVRALCRTLWPWIASEQFTIERMHGGSFNRVIGITVPSMSGNILEENYVLRIPRFDRIRMEPELATLFFMRSYTAIPVPEVIAYDLTTENPINNIYNIQLKLPGVRLVDVYREISQAERLSIVRQLAQIMAHMHNHSSSTPGMLDTANIDLTKIIPRDEDETSVPEVRLVDFLSNTYKDLRGETMWGGMVDDSAKKKSILQLLIEQFDGWQEFGRKLDRGEEEDKLMERFRTVTRQMEQMGFLTGEGYVLFHPNLDAQNVLVNKEESGWRVSGILDWDGTAFVPYAVACRPPTWIWSNWDEEEEEGEEENIRCILPKDSEGQERKRLFDDLMPLSYRAHAYQKHHQFVRRLFKFATDGFLYDHIYEKADKFFNDWEHAFPTTKETVSEPVPNRKRRSLRSRASKVRTKLQDCCIIT